MDDALKGTYTLTATQEEANQRLDLYLLKQFETLTRSRISRLITDGHILVNGAPTKAGQRIRPGTIITVTIPVPERDSLEPEQLPLDIRFEDEHLLIINKAVDTVVHPSRGHPSGTLMNAVLYHCPDLAGIGDVIRPGVVHRLDKDTTGLILFAKTETCHVALSRLIKERQVHRHYLALVRGTHMADKGTWDTLFNRHPKDRKRFSSRVKSGKRAITHFRVLLRSRALALLALQLETGRTHQIRVHLSEHGYPIIGDQHYGRNATTRLKGTFPNEYQAVISLDHQALHAYRLEFNHPQTGAFLSISAPPPADLTSVLDALFSQEWHDLELFSPEAYCR